MSPSPSDRASAPAAGGLAGRLEAGLARLRGRRPRHVLYLRENGGVHWRLDDAAPAPAGFDSFADWCARHRGGQARVHLSSALVHSLAVDAALELRGPEAVRRYVRQQFLHYHGPEAAAWPVAVWTEGGCGGCAVHGIDLDALRAQARAHDVRLAAVAPAWAAGLASTAACLPAFGGAGRHGLLLAEGAVATWLVAQDGRLARMARRRLDAPRIELAAALLQGLLAEGPPLASAPLLAGWDLDADAGTVPPTFACLPGAPAGPLAMTAWLLDRVGAVR